MDKANHARYILSNHLQSAGTNVQSHVHPDQYNGIGDVLT